MSMVVMHEDLVRRRQSDLVMSNQGCVAVTFTLLPLTSLSIFLNFDPKTEMTEYTYKPMELTMGTIHRLNNIQAAVSSLFLYRYHEP
jgi:hypothetical protein